MVFGNVNLSDMIKGLESMGFYAVLLPFLLIFTILFAILQKIKLFGTDSKNINIIVAVVIAFFVVRVPSIIATINMFLPKVSMIVLFLLMFLLIIGIFGASGEGISGGWFFVAMAVSMGGLIWAITSSIPGISLPSWLKLTSGDVQILIFVAVLIGGIFLITREKPSAGNEGLLHKLSDAFSSGKLRGGGRHK